MRFVLSAKIGRFDVTLVTVCEFLVCVCSMLPICRHLSYCAQPGVSGSLVRMLHRRTRFDRFRRRSSSVPSWRRPPTYAECRSYTIDDSIDFRDRIMRRPRPEPYTAASTTSEKPSGPGAYRLP